MSEIDERIIESIEQNSCGTKLMIYDTEINNSHTARLTEALAKNTSLREFSLISNIISSDGVKFLAEALIKNTSLHEFSNDTWSGIAEVEVLANALILNKSLLSLSVGAMNEVELEILGRGLAKNTTLYHLSVRCRRAGEIRTLTKLLNLNSGIHSLSVTVCREGFGDEGAKILARGLAENTNLHRLSLIDNKIGDAGIIALAGVLDKHIHLHSLDLYNNQIGDAGAKALAIAFAKSTFLHYLNLHQNKIGDIGAKALGDLLAKNKSLHELRLLCNQIGSKGAKALAAAVAKNSSLHSLDLRTNKIGDVGAKAFAAALTTNTGLHTLILLNNQIGDSGVKAIAGVLTKNKSLHHLQIDLNLSTDVGAKALALGIAKNTNLHWLGFDCKTREIADEIRDVIKARREKAALIHQKNFEEIMKQLTILINKDTETLKRLGMEIYLKTYLELKIKGQEHLDCYLVVVFDKRTTPEEQWQDITNRCEMGLARFNALSEQISESKIQAEMALKIPMTPTPIATLSHSMDIKKPETHTAEKVWHFDLTLKPAPGTMKEEYSLITAGPKDVKKVMEAYQRCPVPGYEIGSVQIVYNPTLNRIFALKLHTLQNRFGNPGFAPKWMHENQSDFRSKINTLFEKMAAPYVDNDYKNVKLLLMWHGTKAKVLPSLFTTGYANLATTDGGYFGKGIYTAFEVEYPKRVYADREGGGEGVLLLNWVACFSAYPVIHGDMEKLEERANYGSYDAHIVPVVPDNPHDPSPEVYYPCKEGQLPHYTEFVVFESSQCLPRYLVRLQATLMKAPSVTVPVITTGNSASLLYAFLAKKEVPKPKVLEKKERVVFE